MHLIDRILAPSTARSVVSYSEEMATRARDGFFDLRRVYPLLAEVVGQSLYEQGRHQYSHTAAPTAYAVVVQHPVPYLGEPVVGIDGWYLFSDDVAGYVSDDTLDVWLYLPDIDVVSQVGVRATLADPVTLEVYAYLPDLPDDPDERFTALLGGASGPMAVLGYVTLLANSIVNADPSTLLRSPTPPRLLKASRRRGRPKSASVTVIDLPNLRYEKGTFHASRGGGVAWHRVRGHYRSLPDRYAKTRTWVRPHSRGNPQQGVHPHTYRL